MRLITGDKRLETLIRERGFERHFNFWKDYRKDCVSFDDKETVLMAGEKPVGFYFLLSGRMRIYSLDEGGNVRQIALAGPEEGVIGTSLSGGRLPVLGDVEFLRKSASPNHVEAVGTAVFLRVEYDFPRMEEDLSLYKFLAHSMEWKMSSASDDISAARKPLRERFAAYLSAASDHGVYRGGYQEAARCLGCSYRQLMRVVSEMYREGILVKEGKVLRYNGENQ